MRSNAPRATEHVGTPADHALLHIGPTLAIAVVVLATLAVVVNRWNGQAVATGTAFAAARAVIQLGLLTAVLSAVLASIWASVALLAAMAIVAAATSAGRVTGRRATLRSTGWCLTPVAVATVAIVTVLIAIDVIPLAGLAVIPTAGIMLGGAMNTTSVAGKRAHDELRTRHGEFEAALSLGLMPRHARLEICRASAMTALIPGLDQTRSVGLVTIPGAFVGMVLGGASTTAAATMQLFVLVALLVVSGVAARVTIELVASERI